MKEQLVTYETAELAKEKGFDWKTLKAYDGVPMICSHSKTVFELLNYNSPSGGNYCSAPTQTLLQKWLREEHKIDTGLYYWNDDSYSYTVQKIIDGKMFHHTKIIFVGTYEETLEAGLLEALKLIK